MFTTDATPFVIGRANVLRPGRDVAIVAVGLQVWEAIQAADELAREGIDARVMNMHTIKPLDVETLVQAARETGAIVTAEDHQIHGGLGGAVAEALARHHPTVQEFVAVQDTFGESGKGTELMRKYGLDRTAIAAAARRAVARSRERGGRA
jgi:transketolase